MNTLIVACAVIGTLISSTFAEDTERQFTLDKAHYIWLAKSLNYYPFTADLKSIDIGISGEYSYNWSIGWPFSRHVIQAACINDSDKVLLAWWSSKERETRVTALAIFYSTRVIDFSTFPKFEKAVARFKAVEAKQRKEEIEFVKRNRVFFKKWLTDLTSDSMPKESKWIKSLAEPTKY